ncbi:MAG: winged helix-turn-helix transcriptional regulator [Gemmatimonadetes bacterium]|nr:winged helix-turn-helix transcriptional regulator [Gemmatimonadota bacterium]
MVTSTLDRTFAALSDPTRRHILRCLAEGEATVGELAEPLPISRPAVSKHLRVLENAGLVRRLPDGRMSRCLLDPTPLRAAWDWVSEYRQLWEHQLRALAHYLEPHGNSESETR